MERLKEDILIAALKGLESHEYKETLESIMMLVTVNNKQKAYTEALKIKAKIEDHVTLENINLKDYKAKFGYYRKIPVIQLALDYVQTSNELFFEKYQFHYMPKKNVIEEVKKLIKKKQESAVFFEMLKSYL